MPVASVIRCVMAAMYAIKVSDSWTTLSCE